MALSYPTLYPTGYAGDATDYNRVKVDRSGALRVVTGTVSIPATTATSTLIGLVPFVKGAKVHYGSSVYTQDLDSSTNVTFNIGYTYEDSANTSQAAGFVSGSTVPQSGGLIPFTATSGSSVGMSFTAVGNGWITITNTAATTTTGAVQFNIAIAYDSSGVTNA